MPAAKPSVPKHQAAAFFLGFTGYFYVLLYVLLPALKALMTLHSVTYWFLIGYCLFIPMFMTAVVLAASEGRRTGESLSQALCLRHFTPRDWRYAVLSTLAVFLVSGLLFGVSFLLNRAFGIPLIETSPWFIQMSPLEGQDRLLLLMWLPMFTFNILGEELLWRGYLQSRMTGKNAWILCGILWLLFHMPFGLELMLVLFPILFILPYAFHKTRNTGVTLFIHGIFNGPLFVLVALGVIR